MGLADRTDISSSENDCKSQSARNAFFFRPSTMSLATLILGAIVLAAIIALWVAGGDLD